MTHTLYRRIIPFTVSSHKSTNNTNRLTLTKCGIIQVYSFRFPKPKLWTKWVELTICFPNISILIQAPMECSVVKNCRKIFWNISHIKYAHPYRFFFNISQLFSVLLKLKGQMKKNAAIYFHYTKNKKKFVKINYVWLGSFCNSISVSWTSLGVVTIWNVCLIGVLLKAGI